MCDLDQAGLHWVSALATVAGGWRFDLRSRCVYQRRLCDFRRCCVQRLIFFDDWIRSYAACCLGQVVVFVVGATGGESKDSGYQMRE